MRPARYGDRRAKRAAFTPAVVSAVIYPRSVPGDAVTLRGGPWDGELCLSAHLTVRDQLSLSVFDLERGVRHQYNAAGATVSTEAAEQEVFRYCGSFACPDFARSALRGLKCSSEPART